MGQAPALGKVEEFAAAHPAVGNIGSIRLDEQLREFRRGVIARSVAEFGGRDPASGFGITAGQMLEEAEEVVDYVPCPYRGSGTRRRSLGMDGYAFGAGAAALETALQATPAESSTPA